MVAFNGNWQSLVIRALAIILFILLSTLLGDLWMARQRLERQVWVLEYQQVVQAKRIQDLEQAVKLRWSF